MSTYVTDAYIYISIEMFMNCKLDMSILEREIEILLGPEFFKGGWTRCFSNPKNPNQPQDVNHLIELPLEKLYNGTVIKIRADKKIPCKACVKGFTQQHCNACKGTGNVNGGVLACNIPCNSCNGRRYQQDRCSSCKGECIIHENKYHTIKVPPGARDGEKICIKGEGDALIHKPQHASDIVCTIKEKVHPQFRRCGADLYILQTIDLTQALCGFRTVIEHLDKRNIVLHCPVGKVIKPGDMLYVKNEGMPLRKSAKVKGDLVIIFNVEFPDTLKNVSDLCELENLLPVRPERSTPSEDCEEYELTNFDPKEQVYHVPFRQREAYSDEQSPMKSKADVVKMPTCAHQ